MEEMINKVCEWLNFSYDSLNTFGKICISILFVVGVIILIILVLFLVQKLILWSIHREIKWREDNFGMYWDE